MFIDPSQEPARAQNSTTGPGGTPEPEHLPGEGETSSGANLLKLPLPKPAGTEPRTYPTLDAFVSAVGRDAAGVRAALESWVGQAPSPEHQAERRAQLHYRLFLAGDTAELENLRVLAAANPALREVAMYLRLAVQDLDESWS